MGYFNSNEIWYFCPASTHNFLECTLPRGQVQPSSVEKVMNFDLWYLETSIFWERVCSHQETIASHGPLEVSYLSHLAFCIQFRRTFQRSLLFITNIMCVVFCDQPREPFLLPRIYSSNRTK